MSSHESNKPHSDDWHTPPEIIAAFPPFDLDPCASDRQTTRTARRLICWPTNGLFESWEGTIWLNPPYGAGIIDTWLEKLAVHGDGIALIPARVDVGWFHRWVWNSATGLFVFRGRLTFTFVDYRSKRSQNRANSPFPCVLASYGERCRGWLAAVGLLGVFVRRRFVPPDDRFGAMAGHAIVPRAEQVALARTMLEAEALRLEGWPCDPTPARHALAAANVRLVIREAANAARNPGLPPIADLDSLISDGCLGLMMSIDGYEPGRGFAVTTFATYGVRLRIRTCVKNARNKRWPSRSLDYPINGGAQRSSAFTLGETLISPADGADPTADRAAAEDARAADRARVADLLAPLDARSRRVVEARYGLGCERRTLAQLGEELGITKQAVGAAEARALHRLKVMADRARAPMEVA
jgi:RNA polymerase sigma factor (sigma-70 family)